MRRLETTDWTAIPRSKMFDEVLMAVEVAQSEAVELGDENWVKHAEELLIPFLENERRRALVREQS